MRPRLTATAVAGPLATALVLALNPAWGATLVSDRRIGPSDPRAVMLLQRAISAPESTSYTGTQFVSAWGSAGTTTALVEIQHLPGYGTVTTVEAAPGVRGGASFTADRPGVVDAAGATALLGPLARRHVVVLAAGDEVAGRPADVVEVRRTGDGTLAGRFWLDAATGVVLRREVYDQAGLVVRASAFVSVRLGAPAAMDHLPPMSASPWHQQLGQVDLAALRESGWRAPDELPGLSLYDVRRTDARSGPILHLVYSDGLSTLSLFEQRGSLDSRRLSGYTATTRGGFAVHERPGIAAELVWSSDGTVYTLVADAPPDVVDAAVAALPHDPAGSGVRSRLGRGMGRVMAWFNPFD